MSHKKAKRIRQRLFRKGISIQAEPYTKNLGTIYASKGRRLYQELKKQNSK